jgi:hypothetical protein
VRLRLTTTYRTDDDKQCGDKKDKGLASRSKAAQETLVPHGVAGMLLQEYLSTLDARTHARTTVANKNKSLYTCNLHGLGMLCGVPVCVGVMTLAVSGADSRIELLQI